ncbi:MAG: hypothetical protein ACLFO2_04100 [Candidatus Woesearchaeota archaeon]
MDVEEQLQQFVEPFGIRLPAGVITQGKKAYLVPERVKKVAEQIDKEPFSLGLPLGEATNKRFRASFGLLDLLKDSKNKVVIKDDAVWLFTCGRDVFSKKVHSEDEPKKTFLVCDRRGDVLGLGTKDKGGMVKNILDRGDFLRREEKRKRRKR